MQYTPRGKDPKKQYGVPNHKWRKIREYSKKKTLDEVKAYFTEEIKREITEDEIKHLYENLLQNKYDFEGNRLAVVHDLVYCNDLEYGSGVITKLFDNDMMFVKFNSRELQTMCNSKTLTTIHDETKRKIILKD